MQCKLERQENGIYWGIWYFNGKRIRRTSRTKTLAKAREWARRLEPELYDIHMLGKVRRSWSEAVVSYMTGREEKSSYSQDLDRIRWLDQYLGTMPLDLINTDVLHDVLHSRLEQVAPSTANRMMSFLSAILHHAEYREWITRAPRIPKAEEPTSSPVYLVTDEVDALVSELARSKRTKHLVPFVTFAVATGLRMRNITHLEWPQIDLARRVMWVRSEFSKNKQALPVPLMDDAIAVIRSQIGKHDRRVFTFRGRPYDKIKPGKDGTLGKAARRAGIDKHVHPHLFRHTFASWHVMSGTSLQELMRLGGWQKIESVMIYAHLSAEHLQTAAANRESVNQSFENAMKIINGGTTSDSH